MPGARRNENRFTLLEGEAFFFYHQGATALDEHVELVVGVNSLPVGMGSAQDIDPQLEAGRGVQDLVAPARGGQRVRGGLDRKGAQ